MTGPRPIFPSCGKRVLIDGVAFEGSCTQDLPGILRHKDGDGKYEKNKKHSKKLTGSVMLLLPHTYLCFFTVPRNSVERHLFFAHGFTVLALAWFDKLLVHLNSYYVS